jgi:hypothetical protein
MSDPKFGDIVDTNFIYSDNQREVRKFGDSYLIPAEKLLLLKLLD